MKSSFMFIALSSVSMLSAGQWAAPTPSTAYTQPYNPSAGYPQASGQAYYSQHPEYFNQGQYPQGSNQQYYSNQGQPANQGYSQNTGYPNGQSYQEVNSSNNAYMKNDARDNKYVSDDEIAKNIHDTLSSGLLTSGYPEVTYEIYNGNVTLRGWVEKDEDRSKVEDKIRSVDGVKQINNLVNTKNKKTSDNYKPAATVNKKYSTTVTKDTDNAYPQDYAATDADKTLNSQIRDRLKGGWFSKGFDLLVIRTNNGVVTITGIVDNFDDIKKVNDEVKKVNGVRSVNNQLSVKNK